jgi:hypothetical protein
MSVEEIRVLLRAQAEDLARLRHLIDAQAAILGMEEFSLLDQMGREADQLVTGITRRDGELARAGVTAANGPADLVRQVEAAAERARRAIERLTRRMETGRAEHRARLAEVEREWELLAGGYSFQRPGSPAPAPSLIDRVG